MTLSPKAGNAGRPRGPVTGSSALEVNLRRTAVAVVIPPEQLVLLETVESLHGVGQETRALLHEINHAFVGWPQTLEDLHRRAMGDFYHHNAHARGTEAISILLGFYARASREAQPAPLRGTAVRYWLYYLEKIVRSSGPRLAENLVELRGALTEVGSLLEAVPEHAPVASHHVGRLAQSLREAPPEVAGDAAEMALGLLLRSLDEVYGQWLAREDPVGWYRERQPDRRSDDTPPDEVHAISHACVGAHRERLRAIRDERLLPHADALAAMPDDGRIARAYLRAADAVDATHGDRRHGLLERIHWLSMVLGEPGLSSVHRGALHEIGRCCVDVLRGGAREQVEPFIRETFGILRQGDFPFPGTILELIGTIGAEVLAEGDPHLTDALVEEIQAFDFQFPEFSGFTEEWQVLVNPAHVKNVRTYIELIQKDPRRTRRLLAGLVVQLKVGGVFIADTDLFQREVSGLLRADIEPVYHQVKHLLRLLPVFYSDIGAEGELREVSTRLDEISARRDPLCHFLRKQCHVESNPQLIPFVDAVIGYWTTAETGPLEPFLPEALVARLDVGDPHFIGVHGVLSSLDRAGYSSQQLDALPREQLAVLLEGIDAQPQDLERVDLLFRLRDLIARKYELSHDGLTERLRAFPQIDTAQVDALEVALVERQHERALELSLETLERLKEIILSTEESQAIEDIYRKRHIAVGIPSIYGHYREERFEAMGLTFRIESLVSALFEQLAEEQNLAYISKSSLQKILHLFQLLLRALSIDGFRARGLDMRISMLEQALAARGITVDQYINIFQLISQSIKYLIRLHFLGVYEDALGRLVPRMLERGVTSVGVFENGREGTLMVSEAFLRDLIAESFGLRQLDRLVGRILHSLGREREKLDAETLNLLMTYDVDRCFVPIIQEDTPLDGVILLGNKGYMLKRMAQLGFPIPSGFIITTEVFRCRGAIKAYDELRREHVNRVHEQVARLEALSGAGFGDPDNPLLLSVRSGSAISMPGMLDSFLNVGVNQQIVEGFAARKGTPWGAWDAYRRFLQLWGMSHGLSRDLFDRLMHEAKQRHGVPKKSLMPADRMRELALAYHRLVLDQGIAVPDDPYEQLHGCIDLVLKSWSSDLARAYCKETRIAKEWGTAVIVQNMVYGNLGPASGTGVVLTRHPRQSSEDVELYGDFIMQGQGDDVVSGLVETYPIAERQHASEEGVRRSLEGDYPEIFGELKRLAELLVIEHGMHHQEIEFTFEGARPDDLFILQSRDLTLSHDASVPSFQPSETLDGAKAGMGIGVGGGALSGRVAHTAEDVRRLRDLHPGEPIILLRPDTVPDDIRLVLEADGLLTGIGGATSHAAVAAQRLGKTCVVGCTRLQVFDEEGRSEIAGHPIHSGDQLSINGLDGSVYLGRHPVTMTRVRGLDERPTLPPPPED